MIPLPDATNGIAQETRARAPRWKTATSVVNTSPSLFGMSCQRRLANQRAIFAGIMMASTYSGKNSSKGIATMLTDASAGNSRDHCNAFLMAGSEAEPRPFLFDPVMSRIAGNTSGIATILTGLAAKSSGGGIVCKANTPPINRPHRHSRPDPSRTRASQLEGALANDRALIESRTSAPHSGHLPSVGKPLRSYLQSRHRTVASSTSTINSPDDKPPPLHVIPHHEPIQLPAAGA